MAWKRGTTNNQAGAIRKGQIKEFQEKSSRQSSVSSSFKVVAAHLPDDSTFALLSTEGFPEALQSYVTRNGDQQILFLHSHKHPRTVLRVHLVDTTPYNHLLAGHIALTEAQRINSKVCIGEEHEWTVYQGDTYAFDAREGVIGDTEVRSSVRQAPPVLSRIVIHIRPRYGHDHVKHSGSSSGSGSSASVTASTGDNSALTVDARAIIRRLSSILQGCIVSTEDIYCCNAVLGIDEGLNLNYTTGSPVGGGQKMPELDDHVSQKHPRKVAGCSVEMEIVGRIAEVVPVALEDEEEDDEEEDEDEEEERDVGMIIDGSTTTLPPTISMLKRKPHMVVEDVYRGIVGEDTDIFVLLENNDIPWTLSNAPMIPRTTPLKNIVTVCTNDQQEFPVHRRLLRPCIALTSVVQLGKGKYRYDSTGPSGTTPITPTTSGSGSGNNNTATNTTQSTVSEEGVSINVDVDACTFDKVLLYLEHEGRGDPFKFDPLIATELRDASIILGVVGLKELCDKVLGSFQERVRKTPITFAEVKARNLAGSQVQGTAQDGGKGEKGGSVKRGDTWLLLDGMVLDITRWLPEHPGGSEIIPKQSLNVDATVFFEIYHASRQSFLYLKEFYIGELALEDRPLVPQPSPDLDAEYRSARASTSTKTVLPGKTSRTHQVTASPAFLEQLKKYTTWRLRIEDMESAIVNHKSF